MKNRTDNCSLVEQLILLKQEDGLSSQDEKFMKSHLQSCAACREFEKAVMKIQTSMDSQATPNIQPRPQTIELLKNSLIEKHQQHLKEHKPVFRELINFFRQPVPLYQAAIPVIVFILFFIFLNQDSQIPSIERDKQNRATIEQNHYLPENAYMSDWKLLIQQQRGVSASEDTIFSKSFFTSM